MDNDLNKYFVTVQVYKNDQQVHSITMPKSLIHEIFQKWKFPGSEYDVRIIDHTGNFRINSVILNSI
jgi:hypothetical protein